MAYDFFISYSREDSKMITPLLEILNENNIAYFIDKEKIRTGEEYALKLKNALLNTKKLIFIWTKNSDTSSWANNEVIFSLNQGIPIIPIKIGKFKSKKLDFVLASTNWCEVKTLDASLCEEICNLNTEKIDHSELSNWDEMLYEKSKQLLENLTSPQELINKINKGMGGLINNLKEIRVLGAVAGSVPGLTSLVGPSLALMMKDAPKKSDEEIKSAIKSSNAFVSLLNHLN